MDRFDDIWKNRFNEEEFSESDWNTPDENVWEGIIPRVDPQKDKRSLLVIWLGVGIISILLVSILTLDKNKKTSTIETASFENLIPAPTEPTYKIAIIKDDTSEQNQKPLKNNSTEMLSEPLEVDDSPKNIYIKSSNKTSLKSNIKTVVFSNNISADSISNEINPARDEQSTLSISKKLEKVIQTDGMKDKTIGKNVISVPSLNMFLSRGKEIHPIQFSSEFETTKKIKYTLGAGTGATFWQHRISNDYANDLSPFDFNYQDAWGWQTSLSLNVAMNNYFDAYVGFQFEQVQTTSGHNSDLTYNVLEEDNPSNPLNGYALNLATPYGLSGATFNFNRGQTLASDEVDLLVDFNSEHLIRNFSMPIGTVIYPLGKKRKFVPTANLGFGVNYLAQISNKIQSVETHHDAIQYDDSGSSTFVSPDLQKWHFDYRLGLGLKYEVQRNLHLQLNYNWIRGLNPIFKLENYETRIDRHQISIGLSKSFTP